MGWPDSGSKNSITIKFLSNSCRAASQRNRSRRTDKTVVPLLLQHVGDVVHAAHGELVVVELVPRRSSGIHDIIALLLHVLAFGLSWCALRSRVMLRERRRTTGQLNENGDKSASGWLNSPHVHEFLRHAANSPGSQSCALLHVQKWYERLSAERGRRSSELWLFQY